jgi:hypothetical protein
VRLLVPGFHITRAGYSQKVQTSLLLKQVNMLRAVVLNSHNDPELRIRLSDNKNLHVVGFFEKNVSFLGLNLFPS